MTNSTNKPTTAFWVIAIVALIWNIMGVMAYLAQAYMTEEGLAAIPDVQRPLYENIPAWVTGAFAIAVFGGVLGCVLLMLKKKLATTIFTISLIAVVARLIYIFSIDNIMAAMGTVTTIMTVVVIVIGVFLVWYSKQATAKGYLS